MKKITDKYFRWVEWSEEDQCYVGRCPDLFGGGVHDDDHIECVKRLQHAINDCEEDVTKDPPPARVRPMMEPP